jgi:hypothetical protein
MNGARLTRRGKFVLSVLVIIAVTLLTYATRDICWTGSGYGSCIAEIEKMYDYRTGGQS